MDAEPHVVGRFWLNEYDATGPERHRFPSGDSLAEAKVALENAKLADSVHSERMRLREVISWEAVAPNAQRFVQKYSDSE
jgi:hypothetical protein